MSRFSKLSKVSSGLLTLAIFCLPQTTFANFADVTPAYMGPNIGTPGAQQPVPNAFPSAFQPNPSLMTPAYGQGAYYPQPISGCSYTCGLNPQGNGGWSPVNNNGLWNQAGACFNPQGWSNGGFNNGNNGGFNNGGFIIGAGNGGPNGGFNNGNGNGNGSGGGFNGAGNGIGAGLGNAIGGLVGGVANLGAGLVGTVANLGVGLARGAVDIFGGVIGGLINGVSGIFGGGNSGNGQNGFASNGNGSRFQSRFNTGQGVGNCAACINANAGARVVYPNGGGAGGGGVSNSASCVQFNVCQGQVAI